MTFVWSEEAVERLKALHAQGLSGSELASRFGGGLTRSAIFGKLHRLGLTGKPKRRPPPPIPRQQAARDFGDCVDRGRAVHGSGPMKFNFARKTPRGGCESGARVGGVSHSGARVLAPPSRRIGIVDIGDGQCRFIDGDDGCACGHPVAEGSSWCPFHHAVVFVTEAA